MTFNRLYCMDGSYVDLLSQYRNLMFEPPQPLIMAEAYRLTDEEYQRRRREIDAYDAMMESLLAKEQF